MDAGVLGAALCAFVVVMFGIAVWSRGRIQTLEDYLVAGRRLSLPLATATLFATWFGAGTLIAATDEVRAEGLRAAALEPLGPGLCLVIAGLFFAHKLWGMKLITLPDFYRRRFGARAEVVASVIMIPGYFGWIAAQFVALAGILEVFWGIPVHHGIWLVAAIGTGYTLIGGMWSVTLTDAAQLILILAGLAVLALTVLTELSGFDEVTAGVARFFESVPPEDLVLIPMESGTALVGWLSVLAIGALGNIPGQDLAQRIFAAKSARIASAACLLAGGFYLVFGMVPVMTGLAANVLVENGSQSGTLAMLASTLMTPAMSLVFVLAIVAAVMSTIDSAILAPSSVLSNNLLAKRWPQVSGIGLAKSAILLVASCSLLFAYLGQSAYELLETAYAIGMVGLFVPLALGLHGRRGDERAALAAMVAGTGLWGFHLAMGWEAFGGTLLGALELPQELAAVAAAWIAYETVAARRESDREPASARPLPEPD